MCIRFLLSGLGWVSQKELYFDELELKAEPHQCWRGKGLVFGNDGEKGGERGQQDFIGMIKTCSHLKIKWSYTMSRKCWKGSEKCDADAECSFVDLTWEAGLRECLVLPPRVSWKTRSKHINTEFKYKIAPQTFQIYEQWQSPSRIGKPDHHVRNVSSNHGEKRLKRGRGTSVLLPSSHPAAQMSKIYIMYFGSQSFWRSSMRFLNCQSRWPSTF